MRRRALIALLAAFLAAGCSDEPLDSLMLSVTSDAPLEGGAVDTLRILVFDGEDRYPADLADATYDLVAKGVDPVAAPVVVELDYQASGFFDDADVRVQVTGASAGELVVLAEATVRLSADFLIDLHLVALPAGCDPDADGFVDCGIGECCAAMTVALADCDSTDATINPWAEEAACRTCADTDGDGAIDCLEERAGCDPSSAASGPGFPEVCGDSVDNDCDGEADNACVW